MILNENAKTLTQQGLAICRKLEQLLAADTPDREAIVDARQSLQYLSERLVDEHCQRS